jgi:hypothetical protein
MADTGKDPTVDFVGESPPKTHPVASLPDDVPPPLQFAAGPSTPPLSHATTFATLAAHLRSGHFRSVELEEGSRVHHYEITRLIGQGGMSRVFEARHIYLDQEVALKTTLSQASTGDTEFAERFLREAKTLASLRHPNVLRVLDANVWNDIPYVITERLRGQTLGAEIAQFGPLSVERTLDLIEDVAGVFERQEDLAVIHRDIKPHNLYLRSDGTTCVFDYGLVGFAGARSLDRDGSNDATKVGEIIGTPGYMAPEQVRGQEIGPWTDIFALGLSAWEALTGKRARSREGFSGSPDLAGLLEQALAPVAPIRTVRPDVPERIEQLLSGMVAADRQSRYANARDLRRDLYDVRYKGRRIQGVPRGRAFVAIPYHRSFDGVWNTIEDACIDSRIRPTRVDRLIYVENIWLQILQEIATCAVLIADFSGGWISRGPNANVVTEAAHAVGMKKPVIVIMQNGAQALPFDWRHVPVIQYSKSRQGLEHLRKGLEDRLEHVGQTARPI